MNVDHHHSKYLHSIKIKEAAAATTTATATGGGGGAGAASFKVGRRRRVMSREVSNLSNSSVEGGGDYHAQEPAAVPFVWESSPGCLFQEMILQNCHHPRQPNHHRGPLHHHHHHHPRNRVLWCQLLPLYIGTSHHLSTRVYN
ncbi:uncharacterized protein [Spinacia oleracea]|uniref:Uncharacterized protein isoform X2 n=1 Tax=Spinacia oleracea TaxID=3562 RepID=A0ABM3QWI2_SPIOL|nr:uncharacterized protein LOC110790899 isoform X2 [Spinacia oleracea]